MRLDSRLLHETRSSRPALILTLSLGLVGGLFTVLQARGLSKAIDAIFLKRANLADIYPLLGFLLAVMFLRAGATWGEEIAAHAVAARIKWDLRSRLYKHILELGPSYTTAEHTGELSNTIIEGIEALDAYFSKYLPQLALAALVPVTVLVFIFPLDIISGVVMLLTAPLIPVFMVLIGSLAESLTKKQWLSLSRLSAYFLDVLQGLTTLKILGRSREQASFIARASDRYRDVTMSVLRITFLSALVLELVSSLSTAVVAVEIGLRLLYGYLSFEQALFVLILAPEFYLPLRLLGTRFHAAMAGFEAAQRIYAILETPVPKVDRRSLGVPSAEPQRNSDFAFPSVISFKDVRFRYPDERAALNGASFNIEPEQITALVGPSGSGKSTAVGLLLRFFEPQDGVIRVGETFLSEISPEAWRRQVAWVPQTPYLFNDTVAANLRMARPNASQQEIVESARRAGADGFICNLPQGYDTRIGERGAFLSAGQTQQLAIARAFLKDAPLLILDEATSHLDPETEDRLQEAILRLVYSRTTLVIAHRMSTVRQAQQIVVLSDGRVVESGAHAELINQDGLYRRLAHAWEESQAAMTSSHSSLEWRPNGGSSIP
jgi:thiol reductant ABC exporter CydD subunit